MVSKTRVRKSEILNKESTTNLANWDNEAYLLKQGWRTAQNTLADTRGWISDTTNLFTAIPLNSKVVALTNAGDDLTFTSAVTDVDLTATGQVSIYFQDGSTIRAASTLFGSAIPATDSFFTDTTLEKVAALGVNSIATTVKYKPVKLGSCVLNYKIGGTDYNITDVAGTFTGTGLTSATIDAAGALAVTFTGATEAITTIDYAIDVLDASVPADNYVDGTGIGIKLLNTFTGDVYAVYASTALSENAGYEVTTGYHVSNKNTEALSFRLAASDAEAVGYINNSISVVPGAYGTIQFQAKNLLGACSVELGFSDASGAAVAFADVVPHVGTLTVSPPYVIATLSSTLELYSVSALIPATAAYMTMRVYSATGAAFANQAFVTAIHACAGSVLVPYQPNEFVTSIPRPTINPAGEFGQVPTSLGDGTTEWTDMAAGGGGTGSGISTINGIASSAQTIAFALVATDIDGGSINSAVSTHTIQIAKVETLVTGAKHGLLNKTDYDKFVANTGGGGGYSSSMIPDTDVTYDIGSAAKQWKDTFTQTLTTSSKITSKGVITAIDASIVAKSATVNKAAVSITNTGTTYYSDLEGTKVALQLAPDIDGGGNAGLKIGIASPKTLSVNEATGEFEAGSSFKVTSGSLKVGAFTIPSNTSALLVDAVTDATTSYSVPAQSVNVGMTNTNVRTVVFPTTPFDNQIVIVVDEANNAGANKITCDGNGKNFDTGAATIDVTKNRGVLGAQWDNTASKWKLFIRDYVQIGNTYSMLDIASNTTLTLNTVHNIDTSVARSEALPAIVDGNFIRVVNATRGRGVVTLTPNGGQTIMGQTSMKIFGSYWDIELIGRGTDWRL